MRAVKIIRELLKRTTENGCTEAEAMEAAAKVDELMREYDLEFSDLREPSTMTRWAFSERSTKEFGWIVAAIAYYCDLRVWKEDGFTFYGDANDIEIAKYLCDLCDWAIIWAWEDEKRAGASGAKYKRNWTVGIATRLAERFRQMKKDRTASSETSNALVPLKRAAVEEALKEMGMRFVTRKTRTSITDVAAYKSGIEAGSKVNIRQGVKGRGQGEAISS